MITGASRGLGAALAARFAAPGAMIGLIGRDADALRQVAAGCVARGATVRIGVCDVSNGAAMTTLLVVQVMQAAALGVWLAGRDRGALVAVIAAWRSSLGAGFLGAAASGLWFTAFNLSPVGPVRAVGVVEMPIAALAGRRLFAERLTFRQIGAAIVTALGVGLAALG